MQQHHGNGQGWQQSVESIQDKERAMATTSVTPAAAGIVALTARVTDSVGTVVTSGIVNVNVTAPTVAITSPAAAASHRRLRDICESLTSRSAARCAAARPR